MLDTLETGIKIMRLINAATPEELQTMTVDAINLLKILSAAPYGATAAQLAALLYRSEAGYVQGLINILVGGKLIIAAGENGQGKELYKLNI